MLIRAEKETDHPQIHAINEAAFTNPSEANLVDALRSAGAAVFSLVAEENAIIVGHILFSEVVIENNPLFKKVIGLAPLAVLPAFQGQGIGGKLIKNGIRLCKAMNYDASVVLGANSLYSHFGFLPATIFNLQCRYPVPPEHFLAQELIISGLLQCHGMVLYHPLFDQLSV